MSGKAAEIGSLAEGAGLLVAPQWARLIWGLFRDTFKTPEWYLKRGEPATPVPENVRW